MPFTAPPVNVPSMSTTITILDTRSLQKRLDELTAERDTYILDNDGKPTDPEQHTTRDSEWADMPEADELRDLEELRDEIGTEWRDGITLIREDGFRDYAEELADDIGAIDSRAGWPLNCIDWERAACELRMEYSETTFQGDTYLYRA